MCVSMQFPKCRIHSLASSYWQSIHSLSQTLEISPSLRLLSCRTYGLQGGPCKRWTRRHVSTNTDRNKNTKSSSEVLRGTVSTSSIADISRRDISEIQKIQYCDIQQRIAENKDLSSIVTVIVCDIETTGLSRENERIIEIACQDLAGGESSTFQTLVNPERYVPNSHFHGITTNMVCRPGVPRMDQLIPILLQYVRSREKPQGYVLWVAHNGRAFDFPFILNEFARCSYEIPSNWLFLDTLPLAREMVKSTGLKLQSGVSLQALREHYELRMDGVAHRAMADVKLLSLVLQRLTFDLQVPIPSLMSRSFTALDMLNVKKKKKRS